MNKSIKLRLIVMNIIQWAVWGAYLTSMGQYLGSAGLGSRISIFYAMQGIVSMFMPALMGIVADKYIKQMNGFYENISVDQYVIMPNHIHILLFVCEGGSPRTSTPTKQTSTVSHFISTFKRFCNKEYGENIWQRGFHDHVIRGREDYEEIVKYIYENPARWYYDKLYSKE